MTSDTRITASFRDPSGFMFRRDGLLYRQINRSYAGDYDGLMESGLYENLISAGLLISHEETNLAPEQPSLAYKIIRPQAIPFISYPYEWCFSQLKDAALVTLRIQKRALAHGMTLKDASAYNIQFIGWRPVLIDTLSFQKYREGEPWLAYCQFCQHFLAPLALMARCDVRLNGWMRVGIDGVPLDLASRLLPTRTRLDFGLLTHIHIHAAAQARYAGKALDQKTLSRRVSKVSFLGLIDSLRNSVRKLSWKPAGTEWGEYYNDTNYSDAAMQHKKEIVSRFLDRISPRQVWDLGANTGLFSRLASDRGVQTTAFDVDPAAVEISYDECVEKKEQNLLPLLLDLTNPSPAIGWRNRERFSFLERGPAEAVLALALVHHLAISNNVPLDSLASFLADACRWLMIEFVPKSDSQVQKLLSTRADIFPAYHQEGFEKAFSDLFTIHESVQVRDSQRCIYLMEKR